jgi:hypothetical protein
MSKVVTVLYYQIHASLSTEISYRETLGWNWMQDLSQNVMLELLETANWLSPTDVEGHGEKVCKCIPEENFNTISSSTVSSLPSNQLQLSSQVGF